MASIGNDPNGRRRILFFAPDGSRKTLRLGKVSLRAAQSVCVKVEAIVVAKATGHPVDPDVAAWLASRDDVMADKLAAVGLVPPRQSSRLDAWLARYMQGRTDLKPESRRKLDQTVAKLLDHLPPDTPLRALTPDMAADWQQALSSSGMSRATVKTHVGNAKTIFNAAMVRELVDRNPFERLKGGTTASRADRYVTPDQIAKVIEACPNSEWRLLFGLARYAGLRIPSESHLLTWADVDWSGGRLTVRSPKTERHAGHEQRTVPIAPALMALLHERFAGVEPGHDRLVSIRGKGAVVRQVRRIWQASGVEPWPRLWQTLRQSCEKEWAMTFPQYAVSRWIGHSIAVSGKHYANSVPDELYDRAAQNPAQQHAAESRNGENRLNLTDRETPIFSGNHDDASLCEVGGNGAGGNRTPVPKNASGCGERGLQKEQLSGGAKSGTVEDCDLARVVAMWGGLTDDQKRAVMRIVVGR